VEQRHRRKTEDGRASPSVSQPAVNSQVERLMMMTTTTTSSVLTASRQPSAKKERRSFY